MLANQVPSANMLHSVGALMDTSFLREAVADASETVHARQPAGRSPTTLALEWVQGVLARRGRAKAD